MSIFSWLFSLIFILVISFASFIFYLENKKNEKILLSENYVKAKIYLEKGENIKALDVLKEVVYANDSTYSTLSLFLILNQNLITDQKEMSLLFDHLLKKNKFDKEIKRMKEVTFYNKLKYLNPDGVKGEYNIYYDTHRILAE